jgi:hypothetical protein
VIVASLALIPCATVVAHGLVWPTDPMPTLIARVTELVVPRPVVGGLHAVTLLIACPTKRPVELDRVYTLVVFTAVCIEPPIRKERVVERLDRQVEVLHRLDRNELRVDDGDTETETSRLPDFDGDRALVSRRPLAECDEHGGADVALFKCSHEVLLGAELEMSHPEDVALISVLFFRHGRVLS